MLDLAAIFERCGVQVSALICGALQKCCIYHLETEMLFSLMRSVKDQNSGNTTKENKRLLSGCKKEAV